METILVCRFLCGLFGAAPLATVSGGLTDMWESVDRGVALSALLGAAFVGPVIGPISGSFIVASSFGWRWTMWVNSIFGFCVSFIGFVWMPETYAPVLLSRRATEIRFATRRWAVRSEAQEEPTDLCRIIKVYISRPWCELKFWP
jgi:MFS family permease